jgi:Mn-dependent DtxR family transcriptional regulator
MQNTPTAVLRAAVRAEVLSAGLGVTPAQADDIARRVIAADLPELTSNGGIRLASGEALGDALARHRMSAPHLFDAPEAPAQDDAAVVAARAKLAALKPADRLEAANSGAGVTAGWVSQFRKGAAK